MKYRVTKQVVAVFQVEITNGQWKKEEIAQAISDAIKPSYGQVLIWDNMAHFLAEIESIPPLKGFDDPDDFPPDRPLEYPQ